MDVSAIVAAAPQLGGAVGLLLLLRLLLRRESQDRANYLKQIATQQARHDAELDRRDEEIKQRDAEHDAELAELRRDFREQITGLNTKIDELNAQLDLERQKRRDAEDRAAAHRQEGRRRGVAD